MKTTQRPVTLTARVRSTPNLIIESDTDMPEFEEIQPDKNPQHSYTPSTDAKPRTRRRSGGFKKDLGSAPTGTMGEIDPAEALQAERLSGANAAETPAPAQTEPAATPAAEAAKEDIPQAIPEPSAETLAAIERVEARLTARKAERDAKYAARKKARDAGNAASPKKGPRTAQKSKAKKGLLATILSLFGIGTKKSAKGSNRRGGRPHGKGGNRGGQNRRRGGHNGGNRRRNGNGNRRRQPARQD